MEKLGLISNPLIKFAAVTLTGFIALGSWAISSPVGSSPDDNFHLVSIWCAQGDREGLCTLNESSLVVRAPTELASSYKCFAYNPQQAASCPRPLSSEFSTASHSNTLGYYPPIFYLAMSIFATENIELSVLAMRLVNALLFCVLTMATIWLLPMRMRAPTILGIIATIVPLAAFIVPSTNPSSWAVLSAAVLWPSLAGYFHSDGVKRKWPLLAIAYLAVIIGAGARGDAAVYALIAIAVAGILSVKRIQEVPRIILPVIPAGAIAAAFFLTSGHSNIAEPEFTAGRISIQSIFSNLISLPDLWTGALGGWDLGWLDTQMPAVVPVTSALFFSGVFFSGLAAVSKKKTYALLLIAFALVVLPLYVLTNGGYVVGEWLQPRYLLPLLVMFAGVCWWTADGPSLQLSRAQKIFMIAGLSLANSIALHTNLQRYITGIDVVGLNLNEEIEWWWDFSLSPMVVWTLGTLAFLATLLLIGTADEQPSPKPSSVTKWIPPLVLFSIPLLIVSTLPVSLGTDLSAGAVVSKFYKVDHVVTASKPIGELLTGVVVSQGFNPEAGSLKAVSVFMATYSKETQGTIEISVSEGGETICSKRYNNSDLKDNSFVTLLCNTDDVFTGTENLRLEVRSIKGSSGSAPTIWVSNKDEYSQGDLELNGLPQVGDMVFRTYYKK